MESTASLVSRADQWLLEQLSTIDEQVIEYQNQLDMLLDLYLRGDFPKEVLTERKSRLEQMPGNLHREQDNLMSHICKVTMTDDQLNYIEEFCAKIRKGLDQANFKTQRQIIELLNIRGQITFENDEMVLHLKP